MRIELRNNPTFAPDAVASGDDWRHDSACAGEVAELFFPVGRDPSLAEPAKTFCRRCPVIRDCLAYALVNEVQGVWGGTTDAERSRLRRRHGIAAQPVTVRLPSDAIGVALASADKGGVSAMQLAVEFATTPRTIQRHRAARRAGREIRPKATPRKDQP